jgi:putative hydrolase of the HAD superfamily
MGITGGLGGVIFDLGSTLIRFAGDWPDTLQRSHQALYDSLIQSGLELDRTPFLEKFQDEMEQSYRQRELDQIEQPAADVLCRALRRLGLSQPSAKVVETAMEAMFRESEQYWQPMPDSRVALDVLAQLGLRLGLISNASDAANVRRLVAKAGLTGYFDPALISAEVGYRKPAPAIFKPLLDQWQLPPYALVMVGDMLDADILGARGVGMHQIWLTADIDPRQFSAQAARIQPEFSAASLMEAVELIRGMVPPLADGNVGRKTQGYISG